MILTASDYEFLQNLLLERSAIVITTEQEYLVRSRLEPVAKQAGLADLRELVDSLRRDAHGPLHNQVVEAMTTNETSFFRDGHPFTTFRQEVLPEVQTRKAKERTLRVWSAACSTGQEPYSLAMLIAEMTSFSGWQVKIVGTDLSRLALQKAQSGRYSMHEIGRGLPQSFLERYFEPADDGFQVRQSIRSMIEWKPLNLAAGWPALPLFDVVFMRNVLIYFRPETNRGILSNLKHTIHPQGYLFLGTTENMLGLSSDFTTEVHGRTMVYRPIPRA